MSFLKILALLSMFSLVAMANASRHQRQSANMPAPRTDKNSQIAHEQMVEKAKKGGIDVYFEGDSITRRWGCSDEAWKAMYENWKSNFFGWNAGNFGWGADSTQNILWRLNNGELDGVNPKVIVLLAGTNNIGSGYSAEEVAGGIEAIVDVLKAKAPKATIILTAIFPRNDNLSLLPVIADTNARLQKLAKTKKLRFLNVNDKLADKDGKLLDGMTIDRLHPSVQGYQVWADGLKPILTKLLGKPATTDHAPAPTGDPSAQKKGG